MNTGSAFDDNTSVENASHSTFPFFDRFAKEHGFTIGNRVERTVRILSAFTTEVLIIKQNYEKLKKIESNKKQSNLRVFKCNYVYD